jgi:hypothetical protein
MKTPIPNGENGRDNAGRFSTGNAGGPGNPYAKRVGQLRRALLDAVSEDDLQAVIQAMVRKATGGDVAAARILFDRCLGPPIAADILERIEMLEERKTDKNWSIQRHHRSAQMAGGYRK